MKSRPNVHIFRLYKVRGIQISEAITDDKLLGIAQYNPYQLVLIINETDICCLK